MIKQRHPLGKYFGRGPMLKIQIKGCIFRPIWQVHIQFFNHFVFKMAAANAHHRCGAVNLRSKQSRFYLYLWVLPCAYAHRGAQHYHYVVYVMLLLLLLFTLLVSCYDLNQSLKPLQHTECQKQFSFSFSQASSTPVQENGENMFSGQRMGKKQSHRFQGIVPQKRDGRTPYMKTYVKISLISNQLILYSLHLKYCRFTFKSSFKNTYFCIKTYGNANQ